MTINPEDDTSPVGELSAISDMAESLRSKQAEADHLETKLKKVKADIHRIESADLPAIMEEFGVSEFKLKDGTAVTIKPIIRASLPTLTAIAKQKDPGKRSEMLDRYRRGIAYLEEHGAASIVRNTLTADLGKDSEELSERAKEVLASLGIEAEASQGVNANSLSSWVRERIEAGDDVDHDLFGVFSGQQAKLKPAKPSR